MAEPGKSLFLQHKGASKKTFASASDQTNETVFKDEEIELYYPTYKMDTYLPPKNEKLPVMPEGPIFSLHVTWVATGKKHTDRTPAHIVLVNEWGHIIRNIYIRPKQKVVSYLTPLTIINEQMVNE